MDPFTLMSMLGGGANLIGSLFGPKETMPTQINPLTDQYYQDVLRELGMWNSKQAGADAEAGRARSQMGATAGRIGSLADNMAGVSKPGALDWFDDYMDEQVPGYMDMATQVAERATRGGMEAQQQRANRVSEEAGRMVAQQLGPGAMFSGAGQAAVGEGIATPLRDYEAQLGDAYQNAFMNAYTPLAGQGQALGAQGKQNEFQNAMNQLSSMISGQQAMGNLFGNVGQQALGQSQLYGQRAQGAEQSRHDIAQPFYASPNMSPNMGQQIGSNLANLGMMGAGLFDSYDWMKDKAGGMNQYETAIHDRNNKYNPYA